MRTTSTFEDGVLAAVNLGDDADTTAAIYGQLAGALYGVDGIPARWRRSACIATTRSSRSPTRCSTSTSLARRSPGSSTSSPAVVASCASPRDVAEALAHARRAGLPVAVRSGGHDFAARSSTTGVLIDTRPLRDIEVGDGTVTVGAGARLGEIYDALVPHGRTIAAGCGPTVGIAGLALGGGIGLLGRT